MGCERCRAGISVLGDCGPPGWWIGVPREGVGGGASGDLSNDGPHICGRMRRSVDWTRHRCSPSLARATCTPIQRPSGTLKWGEPKRTTRSCDRYEGRLLRVTGPLRFGCHVHPLGADALQGRGRVRRAPDGGVGTIGSRHGRSGQFGRRSSAPRGNAAGALYRPTAQMGVETLTLPTRWCRRGDALFPTREQSHQWTRRSWRGSSVVEETLPASDDVRRLLDRGSVSLRPRRGAGV